GAGVRELSRGASRGDRTLGRRPHPYASRRRAQRPFACGAQMGRQFRQLRAAVEIPLLRDLPAHEPALHLHGGLAARARALLPARRHACGGRLVPAGRARARVFEAVLLELSAARVWYAAGPQSPALSRSGQAISFADPSLGGLDPIRGKASPQSRRPGRSLGKRQAAGAGGPQSPPQFRKPPMLKLAIVRIVEVSTRHPWWVIVVALGLSAASAVYAERHFAIKTDINDLISPDLPWARRVHRGLSPLLLPGSPSPPP